MQISRTSILFYCCMAMLAALFVSRTTLSICTGAFIFFSLFHHQIKEQCIRFLKTPLLWSMSLLFFLPLLSGLWSENKEAWLDVIRVKLPLLLLPLAFASPFQFSKKEYQSLMGFFILLVCAGSLWSSFHYLNNIQEINASYLKAKSLWTPLENDRVRFSWLVAVAAWLSGYYFFKNDSRFRWAYFAAAVWLIIYLHILAVRTGIFSFYLALIIVAFYLIFKKRKKLYSILIIASIFALPAIAYFTLPSFQNRVKYIFYDFEYFKDAHYLQGGNDAMRFISIKAGLNVIQKNPINGVGFGDIQKATDEFYEKNYTQLIEDDKILPSSEWILYGDGLGILGILLFTCIMCIPFFIVVKGQILWWVVNAMAAFSFIFDIGLEVQYGVMAYALLILCCWKWLSAKKV